MTSGLPKKAKEKAIRAAYAALGFDMFGTAADLSSNFGKQNLSNK
jgi:hypothetical protein